jgi:hypothetical protein
MLFNEYETWDAFQAAYTKNPSEGKVILIKRLISDLQKWNNERLHKFLYKVYGKWPQTRIRTILIRGATRAFQTKFYQELYNMPISDLTKSEDEKAIRELRLGSKGIVMEVPTENGEKKVKKFKNEFALKIGTMDITGIIAWAKSLGVPQEKIDKHKDKPLGLAKMNLGNLIRKRI